MPVHEVPILGGNLIGLVDLFDGLYDDGRCCSGKFPPVGCAY